jgi:phospholipid N-methyltransferase
MFMAEALSDIRTTGALTPSGPRLSALLADPVLRHGRRRPLAVLEVGAGTGPVTRLLLNTLGAGSRLDVVESNPRFAARLRDLTADLSAEPTAGLTHPEPAPAPVQVSVHQTRIEEWHPGHDYDVIVSGLPFTNFAPAEVETIMRRCRALLRPGGVFTYFAYLGTARARRLFSSRAEARRHRAVEAVLADHRDSCRVDSRIAWANLPPARAWWLRTPAVPALSPLATGW